MIVQKATLKTLLDPKNPPLKIEGETYFFVDPAGDINPTLRDNVHDKRRWTPFRRFCYEYIQSELRSVIKKDALLLDVGMGPAQFRDLYDTFVVVGTDYYPYPDVRVVCDFTRPLPFLDNTFDIVIASNVLEHLPNPEEAMKEYARVLRPGGRIIGAVPFFASIHQAPYDFYRYTHFALSYILKKTGYAHERVEVLGTAEEAYLQVQKKMFIMARDTKNRYPDFPRKFLIWAIVNMAWGVQVLLNVFFSPILRMVGSTMKFPAGYGFTGIKK